MDEEIAHATVLRDMEKDLEKSRLDLIERIENLFSYIEEEKRKEKETNQRYIIRFNQFFLVIFSIIMFIIIVLTIGGD